MRTVFTDALRDATTRYFDGYLAATMRAVTVHTITSGARSFLRESEGENVTRRSGSPSVNLTVRRKEHRTAGASGTRRGRARSHRSLARPPRVELYLPRLSGPLPPFRNFLEDRLVDVGSVPEPFEVTVAEIEVRKVQRPNTRRYTLRVYGPSSFICRTDGVSPRSSANARSASNN